MGVLCKSFLKKVCFSLCQTSGHPFLGYRIFDRYRGLCPSVYKINCSNVDNSDHAFLPGVSNIPCNSGVQQKTEGSIPLTLICDNIRDPGNMGTILTSSAAVSCSQILIAKGSNLFSFRNIRLILNIMVAKHSYTFTCAYPLHSLSTNSLQTWVNIERSFEV